MALLLLVLLLQLKLCQRPFSDQIGSPMKDLRDGVVENRRRLRPKRPIVHRSPVEPNGNVELRPTAAEHCRPSSKTGLIETHLSPPPFTPNPPPRTTLPPPKTPFRPTSISTTTLSLFALFTAAPHDARALTLPKEDIVSSLEKLEKTIGQVQEAGSNAFDVAKQVFDIVSEKVKPGIDSSMPILQEAGEEAVKIAYPTVSEASKKAQEAIQEQNCGVHRGAKG